MGKDTGGNRKSDRAKGGAGGATADADIGAGAPQAAGAPQGANWSNPVYSKTGVNSKAAAQVHKVSLTPAEEKLTVGAPIAPMRIVKSNLAVTNQYRLVNAYMPTEVFATARAAERLQGFAADMQLTVTQG